jgi:hypothetical protein
VAKVTEMTGMVKYFDHSHNFRHFAIFTTRENSSKFDIRKCTPGQAVRILVATEDIMIIDKLS